MESMLCPLANIQQAFSLVFLKLSSDDSEFVCKAFNEVFSTKHDSHILSIIFEKYLKIFKLCLKDTKKLLEVLQKKVESKSKVLIPPINKCHKCSMTLINHETKKIMCYSLNGPDTREYTIMKCSYCPTSFSFGRYYENLNHFPYSPKVLLFLLFSCILI